MATYAIGDVQGCFNALIALLKKIAFDPTKDKLWFTGDLVNRGPQSLEVLRFIKNLAGQAITVLGNHDLHLLAVAQHAEKLNAKDTFNDILQASDREELCQWLQQQKLLHHDPNLNFTLMHAGLPPQWDLKTALQCAHEVESTLQSSAAKDFLFHMYGSQPDVWDPNLQGIDRLRFITNCLTRLRFCDKNGRYDMQAKSTLGTQSPNFYPWFLVPGRKNKDLNIIFGHWAALCKDWDIAHQAGVFPLDSGCVWGNCLSAMRLEDQKIFQVQC